MTLLHPSEADIITGCSLGRRKRLSNQPRFSLSALEGGPAAAAAAAAVAYYASDQAASVAVKECAARTLNNAMHGGVGGGRQ